MNNKRQGSLLLEINVLLLAICLLLTCYYQEILQVLMTEGKISADLELFRTARIVNTVLTKKLSLEVAAVAVATEGTTSKLTCQELDAKSKVTFYCKAMQQAPYVQTLYQQTKVEGKTPGTNPLTPPTVEVTAWQVQVLDAETLQLRLVLRELKAGRSKEFWQVIKLSNGYVR